MYFDCSWVSFISVLAGYLDIFLSSFQLISFLFLSSQRTQLLKMEDFCFPVNGQTEMFEALLNIQSLLRILKSVIVV